MSIDPFPNGMPRAAVTGAAMDTIVPKRRGRGLTLGLALAGVLLPAGYLLWNFIPHGLQVNAREVRIATVVSGMFVDDIVVRASVVPLHSVMLDSVDLGRVEEIFTTDGAVVKKDQVLFRLSNPQRSLELLARQAEFAQQISNLSNLRVALGASDSDYRRRMSDLEFSLEQARKEYRRSLPLREKGYISAVALEISSDKLNQLQHSVKTEKASNQSEMRVKQDAIVQMEQAISGLRSGLTLVESTVDALAVRAPVGGRLTGFRLQLGETVKVDQHIGRIDDPSLFKLTAQVDEFFLNRVVVGRRGNVKRGEENYAVSVSTIYPQLKDGRFMLELVFVGAQPEGLSPGQSINADITLGESVPALLLPNAAFVNDSGAAWVYVLNDDGDLADRRTITAGRRTSKQIEVLSGLVAGDRVIVSTYANFGNLPRLQLNK